MRKLILIASLTLSSAGYSQQFVFSNDREYRNWYPMTDRVMGGRSRSQFVLQDGHAVFSGYLSLENNGGFALATRYPVMVSDSESKILTLTSRGDGRRYTLRLGLDNSRGGVTYTASFRPSSEQWETIQFSSLDFVPTFRGRRLALPRLEDFAKVKQVGVMISDKREGPFKLQISGLNMDDYNAL